MVRPRTAGLAGAAALLDDRIRPTPGVDETSLCLRVHEQPCTPGTP